MHFLRKKKNLTLILGGTGKTGRRVAERLRAKGHEVRVRITLSRSVFRLG